ncbi:hypothetical protein F7725_001209 [Dissostichus mawsoni]|uniref:Serine/arginine repetitive matrix protein 1-like n=1 Tax=Dissostichus mawsoni TaxID=36200 RepID=A0A7J5ZGK9_DISMA|nr:hypothetical protein F7725_001209 [Dissostichus mawsoni]
MGCRLSKTKAKTHKPAQQHQQREELHFVDEYGQPITMQVEARREHGHRRRRSRCGPEPYYGHMAVSPDLYSANSHMMMSDVYPPNGYLPISSNDQHQGNSYLPSVSYSLDHLDRLDYQTPEMLPYQPNSESCLIGCYNTEEMEPNHFSRQSPPPGGALRGRETAMSSLPGHTASSQGSSSSSESLISSEPSDSGFHSVSTGEHRRLHKIHGSHAHRQTHHLRSGHSPREQRGRWDLESIPETTQMTHSGAPQASRCTVGNSTTTTVHFHRAERSPTLPRHRSSPSPSIGCHTEPCQRRALWLEQQQHGGGRIEVPVRSRTITDLSEGHRPRRASHPNMADPNILQNSQPRAASNTLGPRSRASYPSNCRPTSHHLSIDRASMINQQNILRNSKSMSRSREEDSLSKSPGSGSSGASDWRGFQTLGSRPGMPTAPSVPYYSTLGAPQHHPRSPPSPRSRLSNQKSVRNQLLRARAYRLARERSEVTTDEDVRGEGERERDDDGEDGRWAGRYWSRTERRRHVALSRQHRERRGGEEHGGGLQGSLSSQTVLELSHMKQNRLRNRKLLDDWTTVEELLTHGTRVESDSQLCPSPLLSVTTV